MNQHDRKNLQFLLNASPETLADWYNKMDFDDIVYACELLDAHSRELDCLAEEMRIEHELEKLGDQYPDASRVIAQIVGH